MAANNLAAGICEIYQEPMNTIKQEVNELL